MKAAMWILWPSFLAGAIANAVLFAFFDPQELHALWQAIPESRIGAYSLGFFFFWALCAFSSALTCLLQLTAHEINRSTCPLSDAQRPLGCRD
jgi:hypothetical protein